MRVKNPLAITVLATVSLCPLSYTQSPDSADAAERDQFSIEATFQQAYVIVHSEDVRAVEDSYPRQFELNGLWRLNGQDTWEACRCYPIVGVWTIFTDFDNPVLGYGATGGVFVEPVFGVEEENASLRFGVGASYLSAPFDSVENPENQSYSLPFSFFLQMQIGYRFRLAERWTAKLSVNYNHMSNGGVKDPNKGINYPAASVGVQYTPEPSIFLRREAPDNSERDFAKRWDVEIFGAAATLDKYPEEQYYIFGAGATHSRQVGLLSALTFGAEFIEDGMREAKIRKEHNGDYDHRQAGVLFGHEFLMGAFLFGQQLGIYVYRPFVDHDFLYQRYYLYFRFADRWKAGVNLKTHRHQADYLELRLGRAF